MFDTDERKRCAELIVVTLAKFRVLVELTTEPCPLCRNVSAHDRECPIGLAWLLLDPGYQDELRRNVRAVALSVGSADECSDSLVH
jgi:hypothetical protein